MTRVDDLEVSTDQLVPLLDALNKLLEYQQVLPFQIPIRHFPVLLQLRRHMQLILKHSLLLLQIDLLLLVQQIQLIPLFHQQARSSC